ncbi:MAG TPA: glutamate-cysteine ligase family protein [Gemmatimonadaceae bacterium]|nr:glutamate-cysteine ligase family protein [Gemmatimonadaceae bacterium]
MRLDRSTLLASVESLFSSSGSAHPMGVGAELELIPFGAESGEPVSIAALSGLQSLPVLRRVARYARWLERASAGDPPSWSTPDGGRVSFEPGGQIEISSAISPAASGLIRDLRCTSELLTSAFERDAMVLEAVGVDPYNDIADVSLQQHRPRYERMARYFDSIGESGARMMRQTASLQINVESGPKPYERWALLSSLAPYVTAIFASSAVYAGQATGHRSYRAHLWRTLDASRTGLPVDEDNPAAAYLDFALEAGAIMHGNGERYPSFSEWMHTGSPTLEDWKFHLSTLFPEVRPRGYFELRSADAVSPEHLAAAISLVVGLVYDEDTSRAAADLLGSPNARALETAGRAGLADPAIREKAIELTNLAIAGCESLGDRYISAADVDSAVCFFDRYTRQGRSPGDDRT